LSSQNPPVRTRSAQLIRGSAFIFACRLGGAVLTFGSQVLLARWMGAAELGAYVIAFSWCILLGTLATIGLPTAAIRFVGVALGEADHATVLGFYQRGLLIVSCISVTLAVLGAGVLFAAGEAIPAVYQTPMLLALAAVPLMAVITFMGAVANALMWLPQSFLPGNVLRPLVFLGAVWLAINAGARLDAAKAMELQLLSGLLISTAAWLRLRRSIGRTVGAVQPRYETPRWIRTALPLLGVSIFTGFLPEITVVLIGIHLPSEAVAIFQVSNRVALLIGFGLFAVDAFTAPETARLVAATQRDALQRIVNRATRLRFWASLAAVAALVALGKPILGLFGAEFESGYPVLVILALSQLALAAVGPVMRLMSVSGHEDQCLRVSLGSLAALLPLVFVLVPRFGVMGAAVAAFLDILLWSAWMRWMVVRHLGIRPSIL